MPGKTFCDRRRRQRDCRDAQQQLAGQAHVAHDRSDLHAGSAFERTPTQRVKLNYLDTRSLSFVCRSLLVSLGS